MLEEDPMTLRRVFVSHYCNVPYHRLLNDENYKYSQTDIDDLFIACQHLIRNYELSPYIQDDDLESRLIEDIKNGKI